MINSKEHLQLVFSIIKDVKVMSSKDDRYSRQSILDIFSDNGQSKLATSKVAVIGCGALGTTITNNLVRAGVGYVKIVDRDIVELNNLQRQILFDEDDVGLSKAHAAAEKLRKVNSDIEIDFLADDVNQRNILNIIDGMDVVVDGTDNMLIRFLINDACIKLGIPWIYGGAIRTHGMTMTIVPGIGPCFRCMVPELPEMGSMPTCDTMGVINSIPAIIASMESNEALKLILGEEPNTSLLVYDVWDHDMKLLKIGKRDDCQCCGRGDFQFLNDPKIMEAVSICGSNSVQVNAPPGVRISFSELKDRLEKVGCVQVGEVFLKLTMPDHELLIFRNGRAIIHGTSDENYAKALYMKYVSM